jgi:hypothetical protein
VGGMLSKTLNEIRVVSREWRVFAALIPQDDQRVLTGQHWRTFLFTLGAVFISTSLNRGYLFSRVLAVVGKL